MADVVKLLRAAIQAIEADAPDLAKGFLGRAMRELSLEDDQDRPWSASAKDRVRFREYLRRMVTFLGRFEAAPDGQVDQMQAREFARDVFPEEPRVVGPFYRKLLETLETPEGTYVRLTSRGQRQLADVRRFLNEVGERPQSA